MTQVSEVTDLLAHRINLGLSQEEMAEKIGVTRRVYQGAESGERVPRGGNAVAFARYFKVSVTDLWPVERAA